LIELLVVVAIVAILASLLLPALVRAKQSAQLAKCRSNLRQWGLSLNLYAMDHGFYPHFGEPWSFALGRHYLAHNVTLVSNAWLSMGGLAHCPASRSSRARGWTQHDYGYNAAGTAGLGLASVGLGGKNPLENHRERHVPTKESQVVSPAELYAIGDGITGGWDASPLREFGFNGFLMPINSRNRAAIAPFASFMDGVNAQVRPAHRTRLNVVLVDGHIESLSMRQWALETSVDARRRWNIDHEPHLEHIVDEAPRR
jgi:type II secretory pathway pseudopilin PulG